jgi:putative flippase GtrA
MSARHFLRFNVTGLIGAAVQLASFAALGRLTTMSPTTAASLAVAVAVVHNFAWHWKWTWADRPIPLRGVPAGFGRFALSNGLVSLLGTVLLMPVLTGAGLNAPGANVIAIAASGIVNFYLAGAVVFRRRAPRAVWSWRTGVHTATG